LQQMLKGSFLLLGIREFVLERARALIFFRHVRTILPQPAKGKLTCPRH
jgi:hypothetical protein